MSDLVRVFGFGGEVVVGYYNKRKKVFKKRKELNDSFISSVNSFKRSARPSTFVHIKLVKTVFSKDYFTYLSCSKKKDCNTVYYKVKENYKL